MQQGNNRRVKTLYKIYALERGVRQGDPLSSYLFVVVVETLAIAIGQNIAIKGITIGKEEAKLLQYTDATTPVLSDMDSTRALFTLLDVLKELSGLRINSSKTEGMWVGSSRSNKLKPFDIKWPDEPVKALGVYYSYDMKLLHETNFIERLESDKKLINIWSSRGLSLYGKVTIIKSLLIPKFVYFSLHPKVSSSGGWTRSEEHHGSGNWPITSPYSFTSVFRKNFPTKDCFILFTVLSTV